jgi:hypothetical protein
MLLPDPRSTWHRREPLSKAIEHAYRDLILWILSIRTFPPETGDSSKGSWLGETRRCSVRIDESVEMDGYSCVADDGTCSGEDLPRVSSVKDGAQSRIRYLRVACELMSLFVSDWQNIGCSGPAPR